MVKQKGITPIIAILVILLVTIAIAGAAWIYISTYVGGMTREAMEITSVDCSPAGVSIYMRNIGTDVMDSGNVVVTRELIAGTECVNTTAGIIAGGGGALAEQSMSVAQVDPGETVYFTDKQCNTTDSATVRYTVIASGRVHKVQTSC